VIEYAAPLLAAGGALVEWRGRLSTAEEDAARSAAGVVGLKLAEVRHVVPFARARDHHLYLYFKVRDTPEQYPRRAGIARKRPLVG
jgi:16S rRNA (guanine527-N7)-methyltransferase